MKKRTEKKSYQVDKIVYLVIGLSFLTVMIGGLALLPSTSGIISNFIGKTEFPVVSFETLEADPNQDYYIICPEYLCPEGSANMVSARYNASTTEMRARLLSFVDNRPNITLKNIDLNIQQFDFTENVPNSTFPDIITIRIIQNEGGTSSLAIYSRSVIGEGLAGSNRRRVENWLLIFDRFK